MLPNPPNIIDLLRTWQAGGETDAEFLAALLIVQIGHQTYDAFKRSYHLYLQSIPWDLAREAWGINAAAASAATHLQS